MTNKIPDAAQEPVALDAIYAAWHGAGIDVLGGDWRRFSGMLPPLYAAPPAAPDHFRDVAEMVAPVPDGWVMVPLKFLQGFDTLAHNYSLRAVPPDYYTGTEGDAFSAAYALCGSDLRKLRDLLAAPPVAPAVPLTTEQITQIARKHGIVYTNRHYAESPAVAFSHAGLMAFLAEVGIGGGNG